MTRCKHNLGWVSEKNINIFVFKDGKVTIDFQGKKRAFPKVKFICNNIDCRAERNIYLDCDVIKYGKINYSKDEKEVSK